MWGGKLELKIYFDLHWPEMGSSQLHFCLEKAWSLENNRGVVNIKKHCGGQGMHQHTQTMSQPFTNKMAGGLGHVTVTTTLGLIVKL